MFSTLNAHKLRIFLLRKKDGALKPYGKISRVVFHPSKPMAVGVVVKRPDLLWMFKRKERFVAFDRLLVCDAGGYLVQDQPDAWDSTACRRLGLDYDKCLFWDHMDCVNGDGEQLGKISSVFFDEDTFVVDHIDISAGTAERALTGARNIAADHIRGYRDGAIVVDVAPGDICSAGGVAGKAGQAWASAKHKAGQARQATDARATQIADGAGDAAEETGEKLGRQIGAWGRMFKDFKSEYDKETKGERS